MFGDHDESPPRSKRDRSVLSDTPPSDCQATQYQRLADEEDDDAHTAPDPTAASSTGMRAHAASCFEALGFVTHVIPPGSPEARSRPAQEAVAREMQGVLEEGTFDLQEVAEWEDIKRAVPEAEIVTGQMLLGVKNFDKPEDQQVHKARLVAGGHNVRDTTGNKAPREILYMVNASLSLFRLIIVFALSIGGVCLQADANRSNLLAPLLGKPTYISLPRNLWPSWWHDKFWNPATLL